MTKPDESATPPPPTHSGAAKTFADTTCATCGHDEHRSATCIGGCDCATGLRPLSWPFDPNPPKLIPADNGFRWCHDCQSVAEAKRHECPTFEASDWVRMGMKSGEAVAGARAEFAESLLCAIAFEHERRVVAFYGPCRDGVDRPCVFCDSARAHQGRP